jgi:hypothetical protein
MGAAFRHNGSMLRSRRQGKTRAQEARARGERAANRRAAVAGERLPHPNPWDTLDPTKVARNASPAAIEASYAAFRQLCPPRRRKIHVL